MGEGKIETVPSLIQDASNRQYLPGERIGVGGFASCFRAQVLDRRAAPEATECALKVVRAAIEPKHLRNRFKIELGVHSKLRHPNVVEFHRAFTYADLTYIQLELCVNGSLTDMVRRRKFLTMGEIRRFLIQLCGAVKYLHARDVVHRDIKSGNVFLDANMNAKLGDFGLAAVMEPAAGTPDAAAYSHARRTTFCGTPNYLAPEVLSRDGSGHGTSVDIWALGILAYYLAVGRAPFHSKSKEEIYARLKTGEYSWPELDPEQNEIPADLRALVGALLVEESRRPTADQIVLHPFFAQGFIPDRLDALARTRRPRWARMAPGTLPDSSRAYEELCRSSLVGPFSTHTLASHAPSSSTAPSTTMAKPTMSASGRKTGCPTSTTSTTPREPTVMLALEREYKAGIHLEIPLVEGVVYFARNQPEILTAPAPRKRPHAPEPTRIYEDADAAAAPAAPQPTTTVTTSSSSRPTTYHNQPTSNSPTPQLPRPALGETAVQGRLPRARRTVSAKADDPAKTKPPPRADVVLPAPRGPAVRTRAEERPASRSGSSRPSRTVTTTATATTASPRIAPLATAMSASTARLPTPTARTRPQAREVSRDVPLRLAEKSAPRSSEAPASLSVAAAAVGQLVLPRARAKAGGGIALGEAGCGALATAGRMAAVPGYEIGGGVLGLQGRAKRPRRAGTCYD